MLVTFDHLTLSHISQYARTQPAICHLWMLVSRKFFNIGLILLNLTRGDSLLHPVEFLHCSISKRLVFLFKYPQD